MMQRDPGLLNLRGDTLGSVHPQSTEEEIFQNKTLRPVLKLQNDLLVEVFLNYANKQKQQFYTLTIDKKLQYIDTAIHKDIKFRNVLKGMVVGFFTLDEFRIYTTNSSSINKRMMNMIIERLKDQVQLLIPA
jgi:hypothetical protein